MQRPLVTFFVTFLSTTLVIALYIVVYQPFSSPLLAQRKLIEHRTVLLHVPAQSQLPELYNGCEVTSLSMLMTAAGHPMSKQTLATRVPKDPSPLVRGQDGTIVSWGDPNQGFVGDITGQYPGFGVYHVPIVKLMESIKPGLALDLSGSPFEEVLAQVAMEKPVMVWTSRTFRPTSSWTTWNTPHGKVTVTFDEHAVLVVGFDDQHIYLNDPLDGRQGKAVDRAAFSAAWKQLGGQAVTYQ